MTTLVTGGTGRIGRLVVHGLQECGERVRVLGRRPAPGDLPDGVEYVGGDLTDPDPDPHVLDGAERLFLFPAEGDLKPFLNRAHEIEHVVVLSSLAAAGEHPRDVGSVSGLHHRGVEDAVAASGLPATILRPGTFASNLLFWAHSIRTTQGVDGPYPTSAQAPVHEADVADVAVAALTGAIPRGGTHPLTGPQALSQADQLAAIASAVGRPLTYRAITPEEFTASMGRWIQPEVVAMLLQYWSDTVDRPDVVRSSAPITGRARSLAEWAAEHADAFR